MNCPKCGKEMRLNSLNGIGILGTVIGAGAAMPSSGIISAGIGAASVFFAKAIGKTSKKKDTTPPSKYVCPNCGYEYESN